MTELPAAYYLPLGDQRYEPTEATTSPWDDRAQHGGPPTALLADCLDQAFGRPELRVARISMDFLGPVPRTPVRVETELLRPGRRTQLSEASLWGGDRRVATARVWHLATAAPGANGTGGADGAAGSGSRSGSGGDGAAGSGSGSGSDGAAGSRSRSGSGGDGAAGSGSEGGDGTGPADLPAPQEQRFFAGDEQWGYGKATEWRIVSGGYASSSGAADVWTRVRIPLIAGHPLNGLARFAIVADSANGLSAPLNFTDWLFIPPGVTMHIHRYPAGEWVRLTAASDAGRDGIGLTEGTLSDAAGRCGTVTQPLLVAPRTDPRVQPGRTG